MAVSLPPADDNDELDDDEPLLGAGFTTAFVYTMHGWMDRQRWGRERDPDEREIHRLIKIHLLDARCDGRKQICSNFVSFNHRRP